MSDEDERQITNQIGLLSDDEDFSSNSSFFSISSAEKKHKNYIKKDKSHFKNDNDDIFNFTSSKIDNETVLNNIKTKKISKNSFESLGFSKTILQLIRKKGYKNPTPIQSKTIPYILENKDVVGMARTGSGKTASFFLPLIQRLIDENSKPGIKSIILSPSRELAIQTYKAIKDFTRTTKLKIILLVGGVPMDEQFSLLVSNPEIVVATPGRFLHLKVEMDLNLLFVEVIVYDEADRLFEMGFSPQLNELLYSLPATKQSLLFSATLPKLLVEFAKAGLQDPILIRLDMDKKLSDELKMAFFSVKNEEREACLLTILFDIIKVPLISKKKTKIMENEFQSDHDLQKNESTMIKNKKSINLFDLENSTIIFVPTRHHVDYIYGLLTQFGFSVSYIYGSLDQQARKEQFYLFKTGVTNILVVTDVAARGLDIISLGNVINYFFPTTSKLFVHRVGRTARSGAKGWSYSILEKNELPYLLELELFLGKKIISTSMHEEKCEFFKKNTNNQTNLPIPYNERIVLGSVPRVTIESYCDLVKNILYSNDDLVSMRNVSIKSEDIYNKTKQSVSRESIRRSKELIDTGAWDEQHLLFGPDLEKQKKIFLEKLANRTASKTVFEQKGGREGNDNAMIDFMNKRRKQIESKIQSKSDKKLLLEKERLLGIQHNIEDQILNNNLEIGYSFNSKSIENSTDINSIVPKKSYKDPNFFINYHNSSSDIQEKQMKVSQLFSRDADLVSFDLVNDDKLRNMKQNLKLTKNKNFNKMFANSNKTYIIGESGQKLPASYKTGRFDEWKKDKSENELLTNNYKIKKLYKHKKVVPPQLPDRYRDNYHKQKEKVKKAIQKGINVSGYTNENKKEIKSIQQIRKHRLVKSKEKSKSFRTKKHKKH